MSKTPVEDFNKLYQASKQLSQTITNYIIVCFRQEDEKIEHYITEMITDHGKLHRVLTEIEDGE